MAEDGVQVGTCDNRNAAQPGVFSEMVNEAKSTGEGLLVTPEGGMHNARDKDIENLIKRNPDVAKAIQVLKDYKISF